MQLAGLEGAGREAKGPLMSQHPGAGTGEMVLRVQTRNSKANESWSPRTQHRLCSAVLRYRLHRG